MAQNKSLASGHSKSRNTEAQFEYFDQLVSFFNSDQTDLLSKLYAFPVYCPRQTIEDFLARYELFKFALQIQGDILEFGTFNGGGTFSFAHFSSILEPQNLTRKIVTFDTFEGFPHVSDKDMTGNKELIALGELKGQTLERLTNARDIWDKNRFLGHIPKMEFIKGDILTTLPQFLNENPHTLPALIYLDVDLYEPTKYILQQLIPKLQKGAIIAFDELNHPSFPGETIALLEAIDVANFNIKRIPFSSRISFLEI